MTNGYPHTSDCVHGSKPPCTCSCPVNLDIRSFMKKVKSGNFNTAYRLLADTVLFPAIISKLCEGKCTTGCPKNLDLSRIEQACIRNAARRDPNNYAIPKKTASIAIIGAGLCGLACALKLAARRYDVTVFERAGQIGGSLREVMAPEDYLEEFSLQFKYAPYTLVLNRTIASLDELETFQTVFIATGKNGQDFGLLDGWDGRSMATVRPGVFLGGERAGGDKMEALANGIVAAASIEKYLQTRSMSGQAETFIEQDCRFSVDHIERDEPLVPKDGNAYRPEEAVAEANRCALCDCTACMDSCEFLKWVGKFPPDIETMSLNARSTLQGLIAREGSRMIFSCSLCGQCGRICPKGISLEGMLTECKKALFESGKYPEALHDYYMRDMADATGENYLARTAPGYDTAAFMLFPGCQVTESGAEYVKAAYAWLRGIRPDAAIVLGCCGVPALWAGDRALLDKTLDQIRSDWHRLGKPIAIVMCATCLKTFKEYLPEMTCLSLYEFLAAHGLPKKTPATQSDWVVFDPCASRDFPAMREAVRQLARMAGAHLTDVPDSGECARCCGMGGHIYPANRTLALNMLKHATGLSEKPYITYCTNCRNLFLNAGKPCKHILDDVFGLAPLSKAYSVSQLKKNRRQLKEDLLREIWGEAHMTERQEEPIRLSIPEAVLDKMNSLLIAEEDVAGVIRHCEQTGSRLLREESGTLLGHRQIGIITYWVEYRPEGDLYHVLNVYSHRLMIVGN